MAWRKAASRSACVRTLPLSWIALASRASKLLKVKGIYMFPTMAARVRHIWASAARPIVWVGTLVDTLYVDGLNAPYTLMVKLGLVPPTTQFTFAYRPY